MITERTTTKLLRPEVRLTDGETVYLSRVESVYDHAKAEMTYHHVVEYYHNGDTAPFEAYNNEFAHDNAVASHYDTVSTWLDTHYEDGTLTLTKG